MLAPVLDVMHLEPMPLEIGDGHTDMVELAAGKDETGDHALIGSGFSKRPRVHSGAARARLVQVTSARAKQPMHPLEVTIMIVDAKVLEHLDLRDGVVAFRTL